MKLKVVLKSKALRWVVSITLLCFLLWITDIQLIQVAVESANWKWLLAAQLSAVMLTAFGAVKWWVLMPRSRSAPSTFVRVNFISNFVGIFFPGIVGIEAARIAGITRSSKDLPAAFASVLVDRLFGLLTLATLVSFGGILAYSIVPVPITITCSISLVFLILMAYVAMNRRCRELLNSIIPNKLVAQLNKLYECLDLYRERNTTLALSFVLSLIFQIGRVCMIYLLTLSIGINVPITYLLVVVPVALFVQMLPISVYGIGVRESAMVSLLAIVGVSAENAIALGLLTLAVQIFGALPGGMLFALGHRLEQ